MVGRSPLASHRAACGSIDPIRCLMEPEAGNARRKFSREFKLELATLRRYLSQRERLCNLL